MSARRASTETSRFNYAPKPIIKLKRSAPYPKTQKERKKERHIALELNPKLKHASLGVVAKARASDPNSASSQFYLRLAPAPFLDGQYAIFGEVVQGNVVIQNLRVKDKIHSARIIEEAQAKIGHATTLSK